MVKVGDYYVLVTSRQSGWLPNQSMYGYTKDITNPKGWTPADSLKTLGNKSTYYSQPTNIAVIESTSGNRQYIYMGDRWKPGQLRNSNCVWLPLDISTDEDSDWNVNLSMDYHPTWGVDASTGTVSDPLEQAVDGIVDTDKTWRE